MVRALLLAVMVVAVGNSRATEDTWDLRLNLEANVAVQERLMEDMNEWLDRASDAVWAKGGEREMRKAHDAALAIEVLRTALENQLGVMQKIAAAAKREGKLRPGKGGEWDKVLEDLLASTVEVREAHEAGRWVFEWLDE